MSASVAVSTRCPRLKICPGRPPARFNTSCIPASMTGQEVSMMVGSRLPWMPRSYPMRFQASSRSTRQSTPIIEAPSLFISSSRAEEPVPKWIEIALDAEIVPDALPGIIQIHAPIDTDNRGAIPFHFVQQGGRASAEVDGWSAGLSNCLEDAAIVGLHKASIDARADRADPAIEKLYCIDACLDLGAKIINDHRRQFLH